MNTLNRQMGCLYVVQKSSNNSDEAYYAYLLMFSANDIRERKKLLQTVVKDPSIVLMFLKNFNPTVDEKNVAMEAILNDSLSSYKYVKLFPQDINFKEIIYNKYNETYFKDFANNINSYFEYCNRFWGIISEEEVKYLVDLIYEERNIEFAQKVIDTIPLSEELIDVLESIILINKLNKEVD